MINFLLKSIICVNRVEEDRNILHTIKRKNAYWIGHILRRNRHLKHVIEGKIRSHGKTRKKK
jgi:hypothetical protein